MKLRKLNSSYVILADNGKELGTFELDWDGSYYYWVDDFSTGAWSSNTLREIAELLDEVNRPFDEQVKEYFKMSYKEKADYLFLIFGEKRLEVVNEVIEILEKLCESCESDIPAIELGYWYNVEAEIKRQDESTNGV